MATVEMIKKRSEEINWMRRQGTQLTKIHPILPLPTQNLHSLTLSSSSRKTHLFSRLRRSELLNQLLNLNRAELGQGKTQTVKKKKKIAESVEAHHASKQYESFDFYLIAEFHCIYFLQSILFCY